MSLDSSNRALNYILTYLHQPRVGHCGRTRIFRFLTRGKFCSWQNHIPIMLRLVSFFSGQKHWQHNKKYTNCNTLFHYKTGFENNMFLLPLKKIWSALSLLQSNFCSGLLPPRVQWDLGTQKRHLSATWQRTSPSLMPGKVCVPFPLWRLSETGISFLVFWINSLCLVRVYCYYSVLSMGHSSPL